jgi:hypothetical protein
VVMANQSLMQQFLPQRFISLPPPMPLLVAWRDTKTGMNVIESSEHHDGRTWYHVSFSFPDHLPTYGDLQLVRKCFIGEDHTALQIFPPKAEYVNHHPYYLHLYVCLSEEIVPDSIVKGMN